MIATGHGHVTEVRAPLCHYDLRYPACCEAWGGIQIIPHAPSCVTVLAPSVALVSRLLLCVTVLVPSVALVPRSLLHLTLRILLPVATILASSLALVPHLLLSYYSSYRTSGNGGVISRQYLRCMRRHVFYDITCPTLSCRLHSTAPRAVTPLARRNVSFALAASRLGMALLESHSSGPCPTRHGLPRTSQQPVQVHLLKDDSRSVNRQRLVSSSSSAGVKVVRRSSSTCSAMPTATARWYSRSRSIRTSFSMCPGVARTTSKVFGTRKSTLELLVVLTGTTLLPGGGSLVLLLGLLEPVPELFVLDLPAPSASTPTPWSPQIHPTVIRSPLRDTGWWQNNLCVDSSDKIAKWFHGSAFYCDISHRSTLLC